MKKVIINVFVCVLIFCEIFGNDVVKISAATNKKAEVTNEMKMLKESGVPVANIDDVQVGEENTYTIKSGSKTEEISVESAGNNAIEFSVTDGHIESINPKTKYLGCKYKTYTHGAYDYKYINKFYANKKCTGKYKKTKSYEHFIVY